MKVLLSGFLAVILSACSVPAGSILVHLRAAAQINVTKNSGPTSVVISLYQLSNTDSVNDCTLYALQSSTSCFGSSFVSKAKKILVPGEASTMVIKLQKNTGFIAAVAAFNRFDAQRWYRIIKIPLLSHWLPMSAELSAKKNSFSFRLYRRGV
jgi:type VI secretion system VasD/TssJ family lipoprotein